MGYARLNKSPLGTPLICCIFVTKMLQNRGTPRGVAISSRIKLQNWICLAKFSRLVKKHLVLVSGVLFIWSKKCVKVREGVCAH